MDLKSLRIVQISDIHLFADHRKELLGVKTQESLQVVLALLKSDPVTPDLVVLSGDLSQDYSEKSYEKLAEYFKEFPFPIYYIPGNHDDLATMQHVFPRDNFLPDKQIIEQNWQIILLDSHKHRRVEGYLDRTQLDYMEKCLQSYPTHHSIIMFHHQPVFVGCAWLDKLGLTNAEEFWQVVDRYTNIDMIVFGHVHQEHVGKRKEVPYYSAPSTCIQFKRNSAAFGLEKLPPGYRWIDLYPDGKFTTGITRAASYVGKFDEQAKGY